MEFNAHVASGRIAERECPGTPGVWEYQDTQQIIASRALNKKRSIEGDQTEEILAETDQAENFMGTLSAIQGFNAVDSWAAAGGSFPVFVNVIKQLH